MAALPPAQTPHIWLLALTVAAAVTLGYHPWAEDGGVYMAGVKRLLNPALYPHYTAFVTEHLRFSVFAPAMASLVHLLHLGLPWTLLLVHLASLWLLLYAAWRVASHCFQDNWGRLGAVALTAAWCSLPIAGTSLMLMDPYVTARSIATPLTLLAVSEAMDATSRSSLAWGRCALWLLLAALLHPLTAAYGAAFILLLLCTRSDRPLPRRWGAPLLVLLALLAAGTLQLVSPKESPAETAVAITRYYWFPMRWESYERIGLFAPPVIIAALARYGLRRSGAVNLSEAVLWLGTASGLVGFLFARTSLGSHMVARLQPLRCFQTVYLVMLILLGGWLAERLLRGRISIALLSFAVAAAPLFLGQRQYYPASLHLELPGRAPVNRWVQAFEWARQNTPVDALFAMDANYITTTGEDAQCFRVIAERSAVPDYSKDGGETSITPELTAAWTTGNAAQTGLSTQTDAERLANLLPLGVSWMVLKQGAATHLACPYSNDTVKVCKLR